MTFLREWLLGVVGAALAVALAQSLTPEKFRHLMGKLNPLIELMGKKLV